jgi:ABC-type lipoprotein export system ATPase subunit
MNKRTDALIEMADIHKTYKMGPSRISVLRGASLKVFDGEFVAIMGSSGSGKSTLLHIAGALDQPDEGRVLFRGESLLSMSRWSRHALRNRAFGFVFQFYHLLPELNVLENVMLPAMIRAPFWKALVRARPRRPQAMELLDAFGLKDRLRHRPGQLSGGERQRVAIARALINRPALLLADEPTGNLDTKTGRVILDVLIGLHKQQGQSILLVTHDPQVAEHADRVVTLDDGKVKGNM